MQHPISQEAQELIASLLRPDPTNRPSIDEISDHKFFHSGDMPREIPASALTCPPTWPSLSKSTSELNWRYVSVQAGLGENVEVGQDVGKSVQAWISANENPLKGHVARLRERESGVAREKNVLPMTLSPRVPAPQVGGLAETGLMSKGLKRSLRVSSEDDKENLMMNLGKQRGTVAKKSSARTTVQHAFEEVPEEKIEDMKPPPRRLPPPTRNPSGTSRSQPLSKLTSEEGTVPLPQRAPAQPNIDSEIASGPRRTLRNTKHDPIVRLPPQTELNAPSAAAQRIQAQRATLRNPKVLPMVYFV